MDDAALTASLARAEALCRTRGVRFTAQRQAVLRLLVRADQPLSAYALLERLREVIRNPAPPTVYRALDFLLEQGLAHKLESLNAYVGCAHPEHPHTGQFLVCNACGQVAEIEDGDVTDSLQAASRARGFHTQRPVVELLGACARCSAR